MLVFYSWHLLGVCLGLFGVKDWTMNCDAYWHITIADHWPKFFIRFLVYRVSWWIYRVMLWTWRVMCWCYRVCLILSSYIASRLIELHARYLCICLSSLKFFSRVKTSSEYYRVTLSVFIEFQTCICLSSYDQMLVIELRNFLCTYRVTLFFFWTYRVTNFLSS